MTLQGCHTIPPAKLCQSPSKSAALLFYLLSFSYLSTVSVEKGNQSAVDLLVYSQQLQGSKGFTEDYGRLSDHNFVLAYSHIFLAFDDESLHLFILHPSYFFEERI